jgi:hypothetical protein
MAAPRIYADFQNADSQGRLRLICAGTTHDLERQQIKLAAGLAVTLYADDADDEGRPDDIEASGVVEYSEDEQCWVARIDWSAIHHASSARFPQLNAPQVDLGLPNQELA